MNSIYSPCSKSAVQDDNFHFSIPSIGHQTESLKKDILRILNKYHKGKHFHLIFTNNFRIQSLFPFKDTLPIDMQANLVYEFSCTQGSTPVSYVGLTKKHFYERVAQHANRSSRTGKFLSTRCNSNIFDHSLSCSCKIDIGSFKILKKGGNDQELRILESLFIKRKNPVLNADLSSTQLYIA